MPPPARPTACSATPWRAPGPGRGPEPERADGPRHAAAPRRNARLMTPLASLILAAALCGQAAARPGRDGPAGRGRAGPPARSGPRPSMPSRASSRAIPTPRRPPRPASGSASAASSSARMTRPPSTPSAPSSPPSPTTNGPTTPCSTSATPTATTASATWPSPPGSASREVSRIRLARRGDPPDHRSPLPRRRRLRRMLPLLRTLWSRRPRTSTPTPRPGSTAPIA